MVRGLLKHAHRLRGRCVGRADPQTLPDGGSLLNDAVDGGGVHNGRVHGRAVDVVESHDFEAQGFSLRLVILLKENYWVKAHGPDGPVCRTWFNGLCGANIPYTKENFRAAKY